MSERASEHTGRRSALVCGSLVHARHDDHARRVFRYPVYVASLDLAELPALDRELALFSHGRRNLFAFRDSDYEAGEHGVAAGLADLIAGNRLPVPHTTRLVTNLRAFGYLFNPVSFFLNYDAAGALSSVIAEVNNTYGGRRRYVLGPQHRIDGVERSAPGTPTVGPAGLAGPAGPERAGKIAGHRVGFRHIRELFVSPFLHGPASYEFWFDAPLDGERLAITMHVRQPPARPTRGNDAYNDANSDPNNDANDAHNDAHNDARGLDDRGDCVFVARLAGTRRPLSDRALASVALRYPLMTAQVIGLIHWQALKLRLSGVPYLRPGPDHRPSPTVPSTRSHSSHAPAIHRARRMK